MGLNKDYPLFSLALIKRDGALIDIGILYFRFNPNFEEETLRTVGAKDIINIRSEFDTFKNDNFRISIQNPNYRIEELKDEFYTYLATVLIELDSLED